MSGEVILIVEDNEKNRILARDMLESRGYETLETTTGEEGIRLAREHQPALVLLDIHLPGIDGIETFRRLRADPATAAIPVIAVTASAMPDDQAHILSKPINIKLFLESVKEVIDATG
jgi:two-component system cell cycle response regulator DivK